MNTMESVYEYERFNGKESQIKEFRRIDSHQQLGLRENLHFVRPQQQAFSFGASNVQSNVIPAQRTAFSPVVQRTRTAHIVIPPRPQIIHHTNQQSCISGTQITIPSQTNLRSTVAVMQAQQFPKPIQN
jgi:hypothetical protein